MRSHLPNAEAILTTQFHSEREGREQFPGFATRVKLAEKSLKTFGFLPVFLGF
jgi:hypothetical protein